MSLKILRYGAWAAVTALLVATGLIVLGSFRAEPEATTASVPLGGPFELVDHNGEPFTEQDLAGRPYAIFFGFTFCPDVCPTTLADLALMREDLALAPDDMAFVFVTVDPERDGPDEMKSYVEAFSDDFIGLTGSDPQIDEIVRAYRVYRQRVELDGGGYTMDHTASVFLFDADGEFRATIAYQEDRETATEKLRRIAGAA